MVLSTVSAAEWDNLATYKNDETTSKYGRIEIDNWVGLGARLAEYELLNNTDSCLVSCWAEGSANIYTEDKLFNSIDIYDSSSSRTSTSPLILIKKNRTIVKDKPIYEEICETKDNGTVCRREQIKIEQDITTEDYWDEYKGEVLSPGSYSWRVEAYKSPRDNVDWIGKTMGVELDEWAWWNTTWTRKKPITVTGSFAGSPTGNYTIRLNVTAENEMNITTNFSDLRFLNNTETGELHYWIEANTADYALVWVRLKTNATFYMYYGNELATTTANIKTAFMLGDDFNDASFDTNIWNEVQNGGALTEANGNLSMTAAGGVYRSVNATRIGLTVNITSSVRFLHGALDGVRGTGFSQCNGGSPNLCGAGSVRSQLQNSGGTFGLRNDGGFVTSGFTSSVGNYVIYEVSRLDNRSQARTGVGDNVTQYGGAGYVNSTTSYNAGATGFTMFIEDTAVSPTVNIDWAFVREMVETEPIGTQGAEEGLVISTNLTVSLIDPINVTNFTSPTREFSAQLVPSGVPISANLTNATFYIWYANGSLQSRTTNSTLNNRNVSTLVNQSVSSIPQGLNFQWNVLGCIVNNTGSQCEWAAPNRTFNLDTGGPSVNITFPIGEVAYHVAGRNLTLNWSFNDTLSNPSICFFEYEKINRTVGCGLNTTSFNVTAFSHKNLTFYGNDTFGNNGSNFTAWTYGVFEFNRLFASSTTEGSFDSFYLNLTTERTINIVNLIYNNTAFSATSTNTAGSNYTLFHNMSIPNIDLAQDNRTFFWELRFSDGTLLNTTNSTQGVRGISLDACSTNTQVILNYSLKDEELQNFLTPNINNTNTSIKVEANIYVLGTTSNPIVNFSNEYTNSNPARVCIGAGVLNNTNYRLDALAEYSSSSRVQEFYNTQAHTLNNNTIPINIDLMDLLTVDSQSFLITYKDASFLPVQGAIIDVTRKYVANGTFKTVEVPITDKQGQTVAHLVTEDVIYTFIVKKEGSLLATFENVVAKCRDATIGDCEVTLTQFETGTEPEDFLNFRNLAYTLTFNETNRSIRLSFSAINQSTVTVKLNITKYDSFQNTSICSKSLTTSSGSITCDVPVSFGNITTINEVYSDGAFVGYQLFTFSELTEVIFGMSRILLMVMLFITLVFMMIGSPIAMVFGALLGIISGSLLSIIDGGSFIGTGAAVMWLVVAGAIMIWKLSRREG